MGLRLAFGRLAFGSSDRLARAGRKVIVGRSNGWDVPLQSLRLDGRQWVTWTSQDYPAAAERPNAQTVNLPNAELSPQCGSR